MEHPQLLRDVLAADPLLLTPEEAATVLRVGRTTIYALIKTGQLRPVHIGRSCRLSRAELERYVRCLETSPNAAPMPTAKVDAGRSSPRPVDVARRRIGTR
jgi:excisionase family DNA binding protein